MSRQSFEREFFRLAAWWAVCRLEAMTGRTWQHPEKPCDLAFALLGEHDYFQEMKLLCAEALDSRQEPHA